MSAKPKTKMVSFRLSTDEYHLCRQACHARGARNISELARSALQFILVDGRVTHEQQVRELRERVKILSADIDRYASQLTTQEESSSVAAQGGAQ